ncbi:hypothetical protein [Hahella ganghwensis]|uniref:hypothetical protein n=1 Tax=Hahella ganghwensis TaxID=286420 RepID=UPI000372FEA4|nr:hypothetical protein [Hahella ganghwensis]
MSRYSFIGAFMMISALLATLPSTVFAGSLQVSDIKEKMVSVNTIGLLPLDIQMMEIFPGDLVEPREDWAVQAKEVTKNLMSDFFSKTPYQLTPIDIQGQENQIEEVMPLYKRVAATLNAGVLDQFSPISLPGRDKPFDYSLGDVSFLFENRDIDAALIVIGADAYLSTSRKVSESASAVVKLVFGVVNFTNPEGTITMALVNRDGAILWHSSQTIGGTNFREPNIHQYIMTKVLESFPTTP